MEELLPSLSEVDNGTVLARGIYGFEQAKKKAPR